MKVAGITDVGRVRANNEDSIFFSSEPVGSLPNLFIMADGMGGHNAGEVASSLATLLFKKYIEEHESTETLDLLVEALLFANAKVFEDSIQNAAHFGMGTTLSACVVSDKLYIVHIGDSRIYLLSDGILKQLSIDHSFVNEMVRNGQLTESEAKNHQKKNILIKVLGTDSKVDADAFSHPVKAGDRILLCSDGLTDMLEDEDIAEILVSSHDCEVLTRTLVDKANDRGGNDNISAIVVFCEGGVIE